MEALLLHLFAVACPTRYKSQEIEPMRDLGKVEFLFVSNTSCQGQPPEPSRLWPERRLHSL